jgi:RimJ/RimL family protein N-acetyltransferase
VASIANSIGFLVELDLSATDVGKKCVQALVGRHVHEAINCHARSVSYPLAKRDPAGVLRGGCHPFQFDLQCDALVVKKTLSVVHGSIIAESGDESAACAIGWLQPVIRAPRLGRSLRCVHMNPPVLDGDDIRLVPLDNDVLNELHELGQDPEVLRWTYVSAPFTREKAMEWVQRYVDGWKDGSLAGFSIQSPAGEFLGFAALVRVNTEGREGEAGYIVAPQARGRGVATKALRRLTDWALFDFGLQRVELRMDADNHASITVAERSGYLYEGTLRSAYFKEGRRSDTIVYSRLPEDSGVMS